MKILFLALDVNLSAEQGDSIHTRELARFLGARGNRVDLVTVARPDPSIGQNVTSHIVPARSNLPTVRFCRRLAHSIHADVIYERRLSPKIAYAVSRLSGVPFVVEVNGVEEESAMQGRRAAPRTRRVRLHMRRRMYHRAARVVAVSNGLADLVRKRYGLQTNQVVTIPNGVDPDRFSPMTAKEARERLEWPPKKWILFVGNLVAWQGLNGLLRAMPRTFSLDPEARLAVVGAGSLRGPLEALCRDLGVRDHVLFTGPVAHTVIPVYIGAADVCVAPFTRARNEAIGLSPLKVYEYLSCGRPVIASDLPGVSDVVSESKAGMLVPPDDPDALSAALLHLLGNPEEARAMGWRGREYVLAECTWQRTAEAVEGVLKEAIEAMREVGR